MSKGLFLQAHGQLIEEYLEAHPEASWADAYERTADAAHDRMCDNMAALADDARDAAKYRDVP